MSKQPYNYRTMRWKWIYIWLIIFFICFAVINVALSGTSGLIVIPLFCLSFGWQLGILSERNEWQEWYKDWQSAKKVAPQGKKP